MSSNSNLTLLSVLRQLAIVWFTMVVLAIGLAQVMNKSFWQCLTYSLCISTAIFSLSVALGWWRREACNQWITAVIAIPVGTAVGVYVASAFLRQDLSEFLAEHTDKLILTLVLSLIFGTGFSYYFYSREAMAQANASLREQAFARLADERRLTESHLKLLQAQIEPHFLFNTLSNILTLIRDEPSKAERMLQDLTDYLRVSLQRTRTENVTLGDEVRLLRAYLNIQQMRMGTRLRVTVDIAEDLLGLRMPPLILQPLVENAVRHGIEPQAKGGEVMIKAKRDGESLRIEIADTGPGLDTNSSSGIGLSNVRERMRSLYGARGRFETYVNSPSGVKIVLSFPPESTSMTR